MKAKPKAYKALRGYLEMKGLDLLYLVKPLGLSYSAISKRMCGSLEWKRNEMYIVLDCLALSEHYLPILFPEDIYMEFNYERRIA